jgi:exodeoxyribonuclease VII large subunit
MPKLQSQWEFGDLFDTPAKRAESPSKPPATPPKPASEPPVPVAPPLSAAPEVAGPVAPAAAPVPRRPLTVSELTTSVKRLLEQQVGRVWVTGEITNLRLQSSGHLYFSIKDAGAQLSCVLFRGEARAFNRDLLRDGLGVNLNGQLTVYEARGQYQLLVNTIELQGVGALQVAFEKLKQKLQAEGLFAPERKRPLPRYPHRVGLVTSPTGAAIKDVLHAVGRRHPGLELVLASCRVQGQGSGDEVACAIRLLNDWSQADARNQVDLIIVTRGGGSLEDLWAFNEEVVARAIFESKIPIVSAVGHEIDFTISDFVADFRAATPTAAAEIISEGFFACRQFVYAAREQLAGLAWDRLHAAREVLAFNVQRLARQHPRRWLQEQMQRLDDVHDSLQRCLRYGYRMHHAAWTTLQQRLWRVKPSQLVTRRREALIQLQSRLRDNIARELLALAQRLESAQAKLRLLSPERTLERGYSITMDAATGTLIRSENQVQSGQRLRTKLQHGVIRTTVEVKPDS